MAKFGQGQASLEIKCVSGLLLYLALLIKSECIAISGCCSKPHSSLLPFCISCCCDCTTSFLHKKESTQFSFALVPSFRMPVFFSVPLLSIYCVFHFYIISTFLK